MATHSSTLAWRIPGTEEPDELQSIGSQSIGMTEHLSTKGIKFSSVEQMTL